MVETGIEGLKRNVGTKAGVPAQGYEQSGRASWRKGLRPGERRVNEVRGVVEGSRERK